MLGFLRHLHKLCASTYKSLTDMWLLVIVPSAIFNVMITIMIMIMIIIIIIVIIVVIMMIVIIMAFQLMMNYVC